MSKKESEILTIVTGSPRKRMEIKKYIGDKLNYRFISKDLIERQGTAEEIVREKLKDAYALVNGPVAVEDYSLYIDLLHGFPGPYVKSLLSSNALSSITNTLSAHNDVLCTSECIYGYMNRDKEVFIFKGAMRGRLLPLQRETHGLFGVDQLLVLDETTCPYIDLDDEQKNLFSVRRKAVEQLIEHIQKRNDL